MRRTLSEYLFERFCDERGIPYDRVPETATKTPDYVLLPRRTPIIVEVKEIEPNAQEREAERQLERRGWSDAIGHTPGDRVRAKIAAFSPRIKARTNGRLPGLLVVFDPRGEAPHVEAYSIRVAMYGLEQIHVVVPPQGMGSPYRAGMGYGPKRKMTPDHNTSISAIATMVMVKTEEIVLHVYHNAFARIPVEPAWLASFGIRQFKLGHAEPGTTSDWIEIHSV